MRPWHGRGPGSIPGGSTELTGIEPGEWGRERASLPCRKLFKTEGFEGGAKRRQGMIPGGSTFASFLKFDI